MLRINNQAIFLTKGDSAYITFILKRPDDSIYELVEDDQVIFRLKVEKEIIEIVCTTDVNNNTVALAIRPEHTENLKTGRFKYEVELITKEGDHSTFIADAPFTIGREIENRAEE